MCWRVEASCGWSGPGRRHKRILLRRRLQREGRPLCTRGVLGPCWMKGECWLALDNKMLSSKALVLILRASCRALESYEGGAFLFCFLKKIGLITYRH